MLSVELQLARMLLRCS